MSECWPLLRRPTDRGKDVLRHYAMLHERFNSLKTPPPGDLLPYAHPSITNNLDGWAGIMWMRFSILSRHVRCKV